APVRDDSLLPDLEREAAGDELALRRDRVERDHRNLLAALAGASRYVLGVPRGDLRKSREPVPSRWVLDVANALGGAQLSNAALESTAAPWLAHVASFAADLRELSFPATDQEYRIRSLMVAGPTGATDLVAMADDRSTALGAEVVQA